MRGYDTALIEKEMAVLMGYLAQQCTILIES